MAKHHIVTHGMPGTPDEIRFAHAHCRRRHLAACRLAEAVTG
jgi:hypothetical protein